MDTRYRVPILDNAIDKGIVQGIVQGRAVSLLDLLATRGFVVPEAISAKVMTCIDTDLLKMWAIRAVDAKDLDEIFAD